jgi:hypothetical protein
MAPSNPPDKPDQPDSQSQSIPSHPPHPSLFGMIFDVPRAIFDHGAEHGREWRRVCSKEGTSSNPQERDHCVSRGHWNRRGKQNEKQTAASDDEVCCATGRRRNGDGDWYAWTRRELEKGERMAKELYDSFERPKSNVAKPRDASSNTSSSSKDWADNWSLSRLKSFFDQLHALSAQQLPFPFTNSFNTRHFGPLAMSYERPDGSRFWQVYCVKSWLVEDTEYSPISLEQRPGFNTSCRAAFEDLLRADQGLKMLDAKEARDSCAQDWSQWLRRFEPQPPEFAEHINTSQAPGFGPEDWVSQLQRGATGFTSELDAYEKFLSRQIDGPDATEHGSVSVQRTVNSQTNPDGSITTKTTEQKRFGDGRVESSERVETIPAPKQPSIEERSPTKPLENKKGWFWSS